MSRKALLVGIDEYETFPSLTSCVKDVEAMENALSFHDDDERNYFCKKLVSSEQNVTRATLSKHLDMLFADSEGEDRLFYFSGHGVQKETDGYLATFDGITDDWGLGMSTVLTRANKAGAKSTLIILDCCHSGQLGNPPDSHKAELGEGVTILTASRSTQKAIAMGDKSVFTELVTLALKGGAADVRGLISAASIYAYVEQALGPWDQRPIYKSYAASLKPIRKCKPAVSDKLLRELPVLFDNPDSKITLDPSYEFSNVEGATHFTPPPANEQNVETYNKLKTLRNARLLQTSRDKDLYFVAMENTQDRDPAEWDYIQLSPLGQLYWQLAKGDKI